MTHRSRPKAYSYVRFSTPEQITGDSLRRQTVAAAEYAAAHNLELVNDRYSDLGISAFHSANAETGMLFEFMEAVRNQSILRGSYLLIESMDRLSRAKPRKAIRLLESICEEGITVVTLSDGKIYTDETLDDDPMAFMWAFMVAIRANEESAMKSRRMKAAWTAKRTTASERILTARIPSWLRLVGHRPHRRFEVVEERAAVVRRVYEMALRGIGQNRIAEILNQEAVPAFNRNNTWQPSYMMRLLRSETVIGTYLPNILDPTETNRKNLTRIGKIEGYYPAIVDINTYNDVQAMRNTKTEGGTQIVRATTRNVIAGIGRCSLCGGMIRLVTKNQKYRYLVCARALTDKSCAYVSVRHEMVEKALLRDGRHWRPRRKNTRKTSNMEKVAGNEPDVSTAMIETRLKRLHSARQQVCVWAVNAALRMLVESAVLDAGKQTLRLDWRHGAVTSVHFGTSI